MKKMLPVLTTGLLLLSACSGSNGPVYTDAPINYGKAQLVIYEPHSLKITDEHVDVNGAHACDLSSSTYCVVTIEPGNNLVSASIWDMPGTSKLTVAAKKGERYFVKVEPSIGNGMAFAAFGIPGGAIEGGGPYSITLMPNGSEVTNLHKVQ